MPETGANNLGVVVIGRNEGERLMTCLRSLKQTTSAIVYVDSGSTDGSSKAAIEMGVQVVNLDLSIPFTAARARNAGFSELMKIHAKMKYVQFVDGDCEVVSSWLSRARDYLDANSDVAIVCGRRRERFPERSIFNYQCNVEWNTPIGIAKACGGDFMCRSEVFEEVGGFNPNLIAGEEPELCIRIRHKGWKIVRVDEEMTLHDAAILQVKQWWKRSVRTGHAYAEGASIHGNAPEFHWVRETRRALVWGGLLPVLILLTFILNGWFALALASLYPLQILRISKQFSNYDKPWHLACLLVVSKFAEISGVLVFWRNHLLKRQGRIIEYK